MYLQIEDVKKSFGTQVKVQVLGGVSTSVEKGEMCVILGPSGSGKSTLLNVIGALDPVDSGKIIVNGSDITKLNKKQQNEFRRSTLGFVFQFYNLIPNLTVKENIDVCRYLTEDPLDLEELLETLGLSEHRYKFPSQLSGGQQQRCSLARALIKNPKLLLCDEPTGALDTSMSRDLLILLEKINKKYGTTMIIVTHNTEIKDMVNRVIMIKDGLINRDYINENPIPAEDIEW